MKNKKIIIISIIILILLAGLLYYKPVNQKQAQLQKIYCIEESRQVKLCIAQYDPVCGFPKNETYSNSCFACINKNIEYFTRGECVGE